jgi:hypothetical protein
MIPTSGSSPPRKRRAHHGGVSLINLGEIKMTSINRIYSIGLVFAACILLISCGKSSNDSAAAPSTTSIQTIRWQLDGNGSVQFLTNDAQYYGYYFWNTYTQTNELPMSTVTATVMKQSGCLYSGYGIVFCYQDNNNFYRLLIDADGQYSVYAKVGGTYSAIIPWTTTPSEHLNSGVGVANVIGVTQQSPGNFLVNFNGTQETLFSDGSFTGGKVGFYAYIDDQTGENFPYTPEDIRFKLSSPVAYP